MHDLERNRQVVERLLAAADAGDHDLVRRFFGADYVDHDPSEARRGASPLVVLEQAFEQFRLAFDDVRHTLHETIAERDLVAARISVAAIHRRPLFGIPPSGRLICNDSIVVYRVRDARIVERWCRERRPTRELLLEAGRRPGPEP